MTADPDRQRAMSHDERDRLVAQVTAGHALAGAPLDDVDVDRLRRLTRGELTIAAAYAELDAEFGPPRPDPAEGL